MPSLVISTNISKDKVTKEFLTTTVDLVAKALGKPKSYVVVQVIPDALMSWAGDEAPAALCRLSSIGKIDAATNKKTSSVLYPHIEKHLGIAGDRMYVIFEDLSPANCAHNGSTFA